MKSTTLSMAGYRLTGPRANRSMEFLLACWPVGLLAPRQHVDGRRQTLEVERLHEVAALRFVEELPCVFAVDVAGNEYKPARHFRTDLTGAAIQLLAAQLRHSHVAN